MTLLRSGSATDTGLVRSVNQDLAVDALTVAFGRQPSGAGLAEAVTEANTVVWQQSQENTELRGMGTTLTALGLVNENGRDVLALVNVGDSRSYRFHDGDLTQITTDHSLAEEMVRTGELTSSEAAVHPHRHILTRALGVSSEVSVDLWRIQPVRGDRYLLCSDGLTNELDSDQIKEVLSSIGDPERAAGLLVQAARTHGGSDNITVVVVDVVVGEDDPPEAAAAVAAGLPGLGGRGGASQPPRAAPGPTPGAPVGPRPPAHHLPDAPVRRPARRRGRRRLLRRALVRHELLLRGCRQQRAGHLPGPGGRVPLVPPGPCGSDRGHHGRCTVHLPRRPPGRGGGDLGGRRPQLRVQPGVGTVQPAEPPGGLPSVAPAPTTTKAP